MKRIDLEHIIRAAAEIADDTEIIVIGSQAILGSFPNAPEILLISMERLFPLVTPRAREVSVSAPRQPLNQLHEEKPLPVMLLETMERSDIRVIELGEESGFALETIKTLFVLGELLGKNFMATLSRPGGHFRVRTKLVRRRDCDIFRTEPRCAVGERRCAI